nr:TIGR04282 family arsenosugar biosynthesis glycosyltransferase [Synechococcus sp. RSCCF101]
MRLVAMARWPAPLRCKRRLAADLGPRRAAAIQRRLTGHTAAVLREAQRQLGMEVLLAVSGAGPHARRRWRTQLGLPAACDQGRGSLGVRLRRQALAALTDGRRGVLLIGTDLPQLQCQDLERAGRLLEQHPIVLGPSDDGGYWLLGLRSAPAWLFSGIPWGGPGVQAATLERAAAHGWRAGLLMARNDLDRKSDLASWRG